MERKKGKKGFVEPEDRKGGQVSWARVEENINELGKSWGVQSSKIRLGDHKKDVLFKHNWRIFGRSRKSKQILGGRKCAKERKRQAGD